MKKKILIGSIFAVLLMLSMPVVSNIQAQPMLAESRNKSIELQQKIPFLKTNSNTNILTDAQYNAILEGPVGSGFLFWILAFFSSLCGWLLRLFTGEMGKWPMLTALFSGLSILFNILSGGFTNECSSLK